MENDIRDLKDNDRLFLNKVLEYDAKLAKVEEHQSNTDELIKSNQTALTKNLDGLRDNIIKDIHENVDTRLTGMSVVIDGQQKALNKIIQVQGTQSAQIDGIQKTLEQFTKIELRVNDHETRLSSLEHQQQSEDELRRTLKKERTKGIWALLGACVAAAGAIIAAVATALIR